MKPRKSKKQLLNMILLILALCLIAGGSILAYITSPKYVTTSVIKKTGKTLTNLMNNKIETGLDENYKLTGNLKINLQSDYIQNLALTDPKYVSLAKLITNLTNTENSITIIQDKDNKKLFLDFEGKLNNNEILNTKYLVENATEYYYIDGLTNTYINNGNNSYFESLNSTTTTIDNNKYIIEKIFSSIANNINKNWITTSYQGKDKIITVTLDEEDILTLGNKVLQDLKKDTKAKEIMVGYNQNFEKQKLKKENVKGLGTIQLSIYQNKLTTKVEQYKLDINNKASISYFDYGKTKEIELRNKDNYVKLNIVEDGDQTEITVINDKGVTLGNISITTTDTNYDVLIKVATEEANIDMEYNTQTTNVKKGKSYDNITTVSINISSKNEIIMSGAVTFDAKVTNDTTITEDISNSVLASTMPGTKEELMSEKINSVITLLMS